MITYIQNDKKKKQESGKAKERKGVLYLKSLNLTESAAGKRNMIKSYQVH